MNRCPRCGRPVPANEWASYRRHEMCEVGDLPGQGGAGVSRQGPRRRPASQSKKLGDNS